VDGKGWDVGRAIKANPLKQKRRKVIEGI